MERLKIKRIGKIRIVILAIASCMVQGLSVRGENTSDAYHFLDIPTSSHVFAMGGTNVTLIDDDVSLADQNPALIGPELDKQVMLNYMHYFASGNFAGIRFGTAAGENSAWAIGMRYLNYGTFDGYDEFGSPTGSFTPTDLVVEGSYSRDISGRWRGGVNLKFAYSSYEQYSAMALAADIGVNYYDEERDLSFSAVLRNMGGQIKRFDSRYARVPFDVVVGYQQSLGSSPFQIAITAHNLTRWDIPYYAYSESAEEKVTRKSSFMSNFFRHLTFGLQFEPSDKFYAALGYDYKTRSDMASFNRSVLSGFSLGAGFKAKGFSVGAAFAQPHKSATSIMLNIGLSIGDLMR